MVILLLGANLGDRVATLGWAVTLISERIGAIVRLSRLYETAPWVLPINLLFLNQVVAVDTLLCPEDVLLKTQAVEQELGRIRYEKWGARMIDIDILYYGQLILKTATLTIPHPFLHQRRFTLVPLAEIAPNFVHPIFEKTSLELLEKCEDEGEVEIFNL